MPLHGKIVVIKRSGGDGTEFPLTATCLFGRRPDCDIRIQLPQVSKEHCRIDLNENKEIILTNLSSVNPTRVNGEALQQSERLKHGDVITIIDRSFRFEYPPAPTPKKRSSTGGKTETLKVLQNKPAGDIVATESVEKRISEESTDPHLKDGTNHDNIQRSLEKTVPLEAKEDDGLLQSKTVSPFNDLYQMIKKSLDVKTPRKSSASVLQTPTSRFCTPKPGSVMENDEKPVISTEDKSTPKKAENTEEAGIVGNGTPKSVKKQRRSFQVPSTEMVRPAGEEAENAAKSEATSLQRRSRTPPKRFSACEVIEQTSATPKSPVRRRSKEAKPAVTKEQEEEVFTSPKREGLRKASPRNSGKVENVKETSKKRKSEELTADLPKPQAKKKRVSFGGVLCPELFDKRLPPDSPLRKGATPRRSLCVSKPNQSLLRRASTTGVLQNKSKVRTPSPKKKSSSSPKASPKTSQKSRSPSPKVASPAKKSPKPRTPSPKAATKSPKPRTPSPKAATKSPKPRTPSPKAATKSPKPRTPSPKAASPAKKSKSPPSPSVDGKPGVQTPRVQGRFSVSHISTPSPIAEDAITDLVPLVTQTPKIPLRRRSTSRETPSMANSAAKVVRRSGVSRASMKVKSSWANIVRFGQTKPQVAAPAKQTVNKKTTKKTVPKPKTPARKLKDHVSTGHADSPVTIVVGRAHKQKVVHPVGAAPKIVTNIALFKKNMKMDEDLTGISEMLKTPANEQKRISAFNVYNATQTPVGGLGTSVVEPSVLNTPEETGEMIVSPLSVTVKDKSYNSEAVQRLFNNDEEATIVSDTPAMDESNGQQCMDLKTTSVATPKQKPELPECLTGVKRIMRTPRQKAEPVEDLRGRLLKTPKQKPEQQECLTGVKRIMKTPKQKAEPIEDLRGKILKTPKQKPEQQECLTGVKRMMKTPRQEAAPVEDIKVELLMTPEQKSEQHECLSEVKIICKTPQQEAEPVEDLGKPLEMLKAQEEGAVSLDDEELTEQTGQLETNEVADQTPQDCDEDVAKELDFAYEEPQDDVPTDVTADVSQVDMEKNAKEVVVADDHLEEVPSGRDNESSDAVETVSQSAVDENVSVEQPEVDTADEHLSEMEQPKEEMTDEPISEDQPKEEMADEPLSEEEQPKEEMADEHLSEEQSKEEMADEHLSEEQPKEATADEHLSEEQPKEEMADEHLSEEEQPKEEMADEPISEDQPKEETADEHLSEEQPKEMADEPTSEEQPKEEMADEPLSEEQPKEDTADEPLSEEQQPKVETAPVTEVDATATDPDHEKTKAEELKSAEDKQETAESSEEPVVPAPVRGRRGKKTEATAPPAVRQTTRGRNAKSQECISDQPEVGPEKAVETTLVTEIPTEAVSHQMSPLKESDSAPAEEAAVKPVRGRKTKPTPVEPQPEKTEVVSDESLTADAQPQKSMPAPGKPRRGRKPKPDAVEQNEVSEDTVVAVETKQQSPVRAKRGRNAKRGDEKLQSSSVETTESQEPAKKLRRGRKAQQEQASEDQAEIIQEVPTETEVVPEPESEQSPPVDVPNDASDSAAHLEMAVLKPKRGRKAKQPEQSVPEQQDMHSTRSDDDAQADMAQGEKANEVCSDPQEVVASGSDDISPDAMETVPQAPVTESLPEVETTGKVTEPLPAIALKKTGRGRRAKLVESTSAEDKQEAAESSEEPVVPAPVRGRRGKKTEATAPPAVRQTTRGRNAKSQECISEVGPEKAVETTLVTEISEIKESDSAPAEEAAVKPVRGRKLKTTTEQPQSEPEKNEVVSDEPLTADAQPQKSIPAPGKPRRGRKTKPDAVEQNEVSEDTVVAVETKQQSPVRAKRGRNAKPEPREVQAVEKIVPKEAEAPLIAEPVKTDEQATVTAKPRRGGRKAKQDPESQTLVESNEGQEVLAVSSTDKPKRVRRGKVTEEAEVAAVAPEEKPEDELEAAEKSNAEPDAPVTKQGRARGVKTSVKNDISQAIPAKRARRGAVLPLEDTNAESTVLVSEPAATSVEPAKRGRRAAAKPTADVMATSDQAKSSDDLISAIVEDTKTSKKSVKWKEAFEETPVKAVRGRKSKLGGQVETEEKDLSDTVVEAQPIKRARRGAKVADVDPALSVDTSKVKSVEADPQPKTRRGRSAKK